MHYQELSAWTGGYLGLWLYGGDAAWDNKRPNPDYKRLAVLELHKYSSKVWLKDLNASATWTTRTEYGKAIEGGFSRGFLVYEKEPDILYKAAFDIVGPTQEPWPDYPLRTAIPVAHIFALKNEPRQVTKQIEEYYGYTKDDIDAYIKTGETS
jgi:hypothetical protein